MVRNIMGNLKVKRLFRVNIYFKNLSRYSLLTQQPRLFSRKSRAHPIPRVGHAGQDDRQQV